MRRTKTTRTGSKIVALALALSGACTFAVAEKKDKGQKASTPYALIAGTVYRPPGFALPGAKVSVEPEQAESNGSKLKKVETVTDARGEWVARVPAVPAKWRVDVKVNGYRIEQRSVSIEGEQRVDTSIVLEPADSPTRSSKDASPPSSKE